MTQIKDAVMIAECKYSHDQGYRLIWNFDHSSCHGAYVENALHVYKMNIKPGGKQPTMQNTVWKGKKVFNGI